MTDLLGREVKRGSAELLILALVEHEARHGYEIAKLIKSRSRGAISFHVGTLYPTLYRLEKGGMILSGQSPDGRLVEIVELKDHPWFVASQFHPEFRSRPDRPHPLFDGFVKAAIDQAATVKLAPTTSEPANSETAATPA